MSAKDMSLITKVKDLIKANVASFKIEGRMKNEHYIATVVNAYRKSIDLIYKNDYHTATYILDVKNAANRETGLA
jgi:putative protease